MPIALGERAARDSAPYRSPVPAGITRDWETYKSSGLVAARNRLVTYYMTILVRPVAARAHAGLPHQVDLDDLIQQGYLGLIDAMDRFDMTRGIRFENFARRRILGAVQDYLRSVDPVPRLTRLRSKRLQALERRFRKQHGRPPSDDELRPMLDLPEPVFRRFIADRSPAAMVSFSHVTPDAGDEADSDAMHGFEDIGQDGPALDAERSDLQHWITRGFEPRDQLIIVLYYYEHMTMLDIGRSLGISESRVSQRLELILECLRSRLVSVGAEREFVFT